MISSALLLVWLAGGGGTPLPTWDARAAEHLLNRASFGANTAAIERALALGPEKIVDDLLTVEPWVEEPYFPRKRLDGEVYQRIMALPVRERNAGLDQLHEENRVQSVDFLAWWVERVLAERDPLRERMVLFWHGHFTSSLGIVKSSYEMIRQNQLFRRCGLGDFRVLLREVAHDPAMLLYLDSDSNSKEHPNENFARELLELYTLGEGNYTEADVMDVARAFTGWGMVDGRFVFNRKRHDAGPKRVLGVEGELGGDEVLEILLAQEACARHVARALIRYFEGREPVAERLERYAAGLRADWRIDAFLRRLFLDPDFYRAEVRASRVSSPLDYLVGCAHRAGVAPDPRLVFSGAALLGQRLFFPPSVRGWEGDQAWATSAGLLLRGSLAGVLLGRVTIDELLGAVAVVEDESARMAGSVAGAMVPERADPEEAGMDGGTVGPSFSSGLPHDIPGEMRVLLKIDWRPQLNLTQRLGRAGAPDDERLACALVEELLAIPAPAELVARVAGRLRAERTRQDLGDSPWTERPELCEPLLRELAHGILTLPEAQMD